LLGGSLIILSGVSGAYDMMSQFAEGLDTLFGPDFTLSFEITISILSVLTSLGGLGVIIGGFVLTTRKVEVGRNIVFVAMLTAILGLIMSLFQHALSASFQMSLGIQVMQSLGWIGGIMALVGRIVAEQKPMVDR
jgi:hypothetical protein